MRFIIFCEPCGCKQIINEDCQLREIPTTAVQTNIPKLDTITNKTIPAKSKPQAKRYKCPKCGRGVVAKSLPEVYTKIISEREKEAIEKAEQESMQKDGWVPTPVTQQDKEVIQQARRKSYEKDHSP